MLLMFEARRYRSSSAPDIHPKYDAGDQPTLILQSNRMKAEKANCLGRHQSPGSPLRRPPDATSDDGDSRTKAASFMFIHVYNKFKVLVSFSPLLEMHLKFFKTRKTSTDD